MSKWFIALVALVFSCAISTSWRAQANEPGFLPILNLTLPESDLQFLFSLRQVHQPDQVFAQLKKAFPELRVVIFTPSQPNQFPHGWTTFTWRDPQVAPEDAYFYQRLAQGSMEFIPAYERKNGGALREHPVILFPNQIGKEAILHMALLFLIDRTRIARYSLRQLSYVDFRKKELARLRELDQSNVSAPKSVELKTRLLLSGLEEARVRLGEKIEIVQFLLRNQMGLGIWEPQVVYQLHEALPYIDDLTQRMTILSGLFNQQVLAPARKPTTIDRQFLDQYQTESAQLMRALQSARDYLSQDRAVVDQQGSSDGSCGGLKN